MRASTERHTLIIGDKQSQVIQATVVDYGFDLLDDYGQVLEDMKDDFLQWSYNEDYDGEVVAIPPEFIKIAKEIGTSKTERDSCWNSETLEEDV